MGFEINENMTMTEFASAIQSVMTGAVNAVDDFDRLAHFAIRHMRDNQTNSGAPDMGLFKSLFEAAFNVSQRFKDSDKGKAKIAANFTSAAQKYAEEHFGLSFKWSKKAGITLSIIKDEQGNPVIPFGDVDWDTALETSVFTRPEKEKPSESEKLLKQAETFEKKAKKAQKDGHKDLATALMNLSDVYNKYALAAIAAEQAGSISVADQWVGARETDVLEKESA